MEKQQINTNFFIPMPVVLIGTRVNGKDNFMPAGWCMRTNLNPPMIACGIHNSHYTTDAIKKVETFSVNIPSTKLLEKTDYCGIVSGKKVDKSKDFETFTGSLNTAPMIKDCPATLECQLFKTVDLPTHSLFIGEIVGVYVDETVISDGKPDFSRIDPLFLTMPENKYWTLGKHAGNAWSDGKNLKKY